MTNAENFFFLFFFIPEIRFFQLFIIGIFFSIIETKNTICFSKKPKFLLSSTLRRQIDIIHLPNIRHDRLFL